MIALSPVHNDDPALALSPLLRSTLLTLDYIETHGPIGLTPLKALKRYFVQWAAEAFVWPHYTAEDLYYLNKVLNEHDLSAVAARSMIMSFQAGLIATVISAPANMPGLSMNG